MKNKYKYIFLYGIFLLITFFVLFGITILRDKNVTLQQEVLLKQAQTHFEEQVNVRSWSASYGGVYVFPRGILKPNPYLENNTLKTFNGDTLIRINPAWMTRQLSELSKTKDYHFRITSLTPMNPHNIADKFEQRALSYLHETNNTEYYELKDNTDFRYMGALITRKDCIPCHVDQGYELGDIRGGISIRLGTTDYQEIVTSLDNKTLILQFLIVSLLLSITVLIHKQMKINEKLKEEVFKQTKEVHTTKTLLQEVLDTDHNFLMVIEEKDIILANKTMLDFFAVSSLDGFIKKYKYISNTFVAEGEEDFLLAYMNEEHWVSYLNREQNTKEIRLILSKDGEKKYFKAHSRELVVDEKVLNIIIFDDITDSLQKLSSLEDKASKDTMTGLFNKGKFNDVLSKEIVLCNALASPISMIFLDIDHFKIVNDTYGHDAGDYVLVELAKILTSRVRSSDFVARWGGEEFVITLQSATVEQAAVLAEKLRIEVENYDFKNVGKQTISLGITQYRMNEAQEVFLKRVDEALYEAKASGRNKIVVK